MVEGLNEESGGRVNDIVGHITIHHVNQIDRNDSRGRSINQFIMEMEWHEKTEHADSAYYHAGIVIGKSFPIKKMAILL